MLFAPLPDAEQVPKDWQLQLSGIQLPSCTSHVGANTGRTYTASGSCVYLPGKSWMYTPACLVKQPDIRPRNVGQAMIAFMIHPTVMCSSLGQWALMSFRQALHFSCIMPKSRVQQSLILTCPDTGLHLRLTPPMRLSCCSSSMLDACNCPQHLPAGPASPFTTLSATFFLLDVWW